MAFQNDLRLIRSLVGDVLSATAERSPGLNWLFVEQLTLPLLKRAEVEESLKVLSLSERDMIELLLSTEPEILASATISARFGTDIRLWATHLQEAMEENGLWVPDENQEIPSRFLYFFSSLLVAFISLFILWPVPMLLFSVGIALALTVLVYMLASESHSRIRFTEPYATHLREAIVLPLIRSRLNERMRELGRDELFQVTSAPALVDLSDRDHLVTTTAMDRITHASDSMGAGSIGVSGPRGVGKSALLQSFCENRFALPHQPDLRVLIPAPVNYEARDFVVHAFGRLCEAVIAAAPVRPPRRVVTWVPVLLTVTAFVIALITLPREVLEQFPKEQVLLWADHILIYYSLPALTAFVLVSILVRSRRPQIWPRGGPNGNRRDIGVVYLLTPFIAGLAASAVVVTSITFFLDSPVDRFDFSALWTPYTPSTLFAAGGLMSLLAVRPLHRAIARSTSPKEDIVASARRNLRGLRYIETLTTGMSGSVQITQPVGLSGSRGRSLAEQQPGLPQLVSQYRTFATETALWWSEQHRGKGRLVIGIDEIDKMPAEAAEQFVNQVKALFGTPRCVTLVSVSDDALSHFEQRAFSLRDSFDTAFDDIVRVEHLDFDDTRTLLTRRITAIPDSLVALCHVFSGGLPRECLRTARSLVRERVSLREANPPVVPGVADLAERIVKQEANVVRKALLTVGAPLMADPETGGDCGAEMATGAWPVMTPQGLLNAGQEIERVPKLMTYSAQFRFLSAVLKVFTDRQQRLSTLLREHPAQTQRLLTLLAQARNAGTTNSSTQILLVERFLAEWERFTKALA